MTTTSTAAVQGPPQRAPQRALRAAGDHGGRPALTVSTVCLGTMFFGTRVDEQTSFAILDRYLERSAPGTAFLDTANNYNAWIGGHGRDSEELIGRWFAARGVRDDVVLATKCGAGIRDRSRPLAWDNFEGLAPAVVRREAEASLRALGTDRLDVLYAHVDDRTVPLSDVVGVFGELVDAGTVLVPGLSNTTTWRLAAARDEARRQGVAGFGVVQQHGSYAAPRSAPGATTFVTPELLDYAAGQDDLVVAAYSPLLSGAYVRGEVWLRPEIDHAGGRARIAAAREVAGELGVTANQVVLAYLLGGPVPVVPVVGASSVAQLDEILDAVSLELDDALRARLDAV